VTSWSFFNTFILWVPGSTRKTCEDDKLTQNTKFIVTVIWFRTVVHTEVLNDVDV